MTAPEVWLRGALPDIPPLLQPVAHSLLQCAEETGSTIPGLTPEMLARRPGGAASIAYHVRHAVGGLDRLFTYARGEQLSEAQKGALAAEAHAHTAPVRDIELVASFNEAVDGALAQLRSTVESTLTDHRDVGRARLPSTVIGLLFHAAEHTQRHVGQAITTAKIVRSA